MHTEAVICTYFVYTSDSNHSICVGINKWLNTSMIFHVTKILIKNRHAIMIQGNTHSGETGSMKIYRHSLIFYYLQWCCLISIIIGPSSVYLFAYNRHLFEILLERSIIGTAFVSNYR